MTGSRGGWKIEKQGRRWKVGGKEDGVGNRWPRWKRDATSRINGLSCRRRCRREGERKREPNELRQERQPAQRNVARYILRNIPILWAILTPSFSRLPLPSPATTSRNKDANYPSRRSFRLRLVKIQIRWVRAVRRRYDLKGLLYIISYASCIARTIGRGHDNFLQKFLNRHLSNEEENEEALRSWKHRWLPIPRLSSRKRRTQRG